MSEAKTVYTAETQSELWGAAESDVKRLSSAIYAAGLDHKSLNFSDSWEVIGESIKILIENGNSEYEQFESLADNLIYAGEHWEG